MKKILLFSLIVTIGVCFLSCKSDSEHDGIQAYLSGLDALVLEDYTSAESSFSKNLKTNNLTLASMSYEKLIPLLYESGEYQKIIEVSEQLLSLAEKTEAQQQYTVDSNFIQRYLLLSKIKSNKNVHNQITMWLTSSNYSQEHKLFFSDEAFLAYNTKNPLSKEYIERIDIHNAVSSRDYGQAVRNITASSQYHSEEPDVFFEEKDAFFLSDIGKAILYGSNDNVFFARSLEKAAKTYPEKSSEAFMCHFYAGRLYEDAGTHYQNFATEEFEAAMKASTNDAHYDNALWYYFTTIRQTSSRSAITALQEYASTWHDPYYFDEFLDPLAFQLLDNENYKGFYALYHEIKPYFSPESMSKYAYISALLLENELVSVESDDIKELVEETYRQAYNAQDGSLYYRMMAAVALNVSSEKLLNDLLKREAVEKKVFDTTFEEILLEMLSKGYAQEVYSLYRKNSDLISLDTAVLLSKNLSYVNNPSIENNYNKNYYPESLNIAARAFSNSEKDIKFEDMKLLYPTYYSDYVTQVSEVYDLEEYIIYAIMRSESFFDHDVASWAGAIGLTQLMPTTAGDVARKLRVKDYDLHNARQNIDFGMYYFDELLPREGVDNSTLRALFSYNAGITNVRRWKRQFPELLDIPALFLEKIPFAETREYGRKVFSAAVMYGLLYEDLEVSDIAKVVMN